MSGVHLLLEAAEYDPEEYAGHSFRKGTAQELHNKGLELRNIGCFGRWAKGSNCVRLYRQVSIDDRRQWAKLLSANVPNQALPQRAIELEELEQMVKDATAAAKEPERPPGKPEPTQRKRGRAESSGKPKAKAKPEPKKPRADEYARTYSTVPSMRKEGARSKRNKNQNK